VAKCNQLTPLPFKGLLNYTNDVCVMLLIATSGLETSGNICTTESDHLVLAAYQMSSIKDIKKDR